MPENDEVKYALGSRQAWITMLRYCLKNLGYDDQESKSVAWIVEREEAVAMLRRVCEERGDNDWPDDLNLADVIEKHLANHLER